MIIYKKGDLLEAIEDIICHQCNTQGVFGGGLAFQIRGKYPNCELSAMNHVETLKNKCDVVGMNDELRERLEYITFCNDYAITPDVKDDVSLALEYINNQDKKMKQKDKIIKQLNYIINELERYLIENHNQSLNGYESYVYHSEYKNALNKLQELKEGIK